MSVGAVDCASDENLEVCREYDIQAYPSMKVTLVCEIPVHTLYMSL